VSTRPRKKRQNYRQQADRIFSRYIRDRDGHCQASGEMFPCKGTIQCAHIIPRRYGVIRCDPDNAIALCASHHIYWTHRPLEWTDWIETVFPGRWDVLRRRAMTGSKVVWKDEVVRLKEFR
jgi:hypothetical protein